MKILRRPELQLVGIHYHLGRHFAEPALFALVVPGLAGLLECLCGAAGWTPSSLDVGGGFTQGRDPFFRKPGPGEPWPAPTDSFVEPIEAYADLLCGELARELGARSLPLPVLELEPGRYLLASAGVTLTRVGTVKQGRSRTWAMVDLCVTHIGMSRSPRDAHAILAVDEVSAGEEVVYDVVGPLCVLDIIMEQGALPRVRRGNLLAVLDTGAYADGEASNANSIGTAVVRATRPAARSEAGPRPLGRRACARAMVSATATAGGSVPATRILGSFVAGLRGELLPDAVIEKAKSNLLHNLSCAMATHCVAGPAWALVRGTGPVESTLLCLRERVPAEQAAFANAVLLHGRAQDDTHFPSQCHVGAATIPAALPLAERERRQAFLGRPGRRIRGRRRCRRALRRRGDRARLPGFDGVRHARRRRGAASLLDLGPEGASDAIGLALRSEMVEDGPGLSSLREHIRRLEELPHVCPLLEATVT